MRLSFVPHMQRIFFNMKSLNINAYMKISWFTVGIKKYVILATAYTKSKST